MSKRITVIPATGGAYSDLTIEPGTTPTDVKRQLQLADNFVLTRGRGTEPIPNTENLFETVTDGTKLYATTDVEWGATLNPLVRFISWFLEPDKPTRQPAITNLVRRNDAAVVRRNDAPVVRRAQIPYWKERGWEQKDGVYRGDFRTPRGTWAGYATVSPSGRVEIFIHDPPRVLKRHPHWPCFRSRPGGWFFVHPINRVPDVSAGVLSIEKTIDEAYAI